MIIGTLRYIPNPLCVLVQVGNMSCPTSTDCFAMCKSEQMKEWVCERERERKNDTDKDRRNLE